MKAKSNFANSIARTFTKKLCNNHQTKSTGKNFYICPKYNMIITVAEKKKEREREGVYINEMNICIE